MSKGRPWTDEDREILRSEYRIKGPELLARELNRSIESIRSQAFKLKLLSPHTWTEEEDKIIKDNYLNKSVKEIQIILPNRSYRTITLRAISLGIHKFARPSYRINEEFFEEINNESAYALGVVASDGNIIIRNTGSWNFKITSKDKDWLISIRDLMGSDMHLKPATGQWGHLAWDLIITRRKMVQDLMNLGLTPKKSLIIRFPDIAEEFVPDFMRGYHDGNGCFSFSRNHKRIVLRSSVASSLEFLQGWIKWLHEFGIETEAIPHKMKTKIHALYLSEKYAIQFGDLIYSRPGIRLERKYQKYVEGKELFESRN